MSLTSEVRGLDCGLWVSIFPPSCALQLRGGAVSWGHCLAPDSWVPALLLATLLRKICTCVHFMVGTEIPEFRFD